MFLNIGLFGNLFKMLYYYIFEHEILFKNFFLQDLLLDSFIIPPFNAIFYSMLVSIFEMQCRFQMQEILLGKDKR